MRNSLPSSYFDDVYAASSDPWSFETSPYEAAKYQTTLAALPRQSYASALEIGCSIGVLTQQLATRCEALQSIDVSEQALNSARHRCASLPHVQFARKHLPNEMPAGCFDLVVLSEVGYYWDVTDLELVADLLGARQPSGGHLLLVHFTEFVPDYPLTGDQVHEALLLRPEWRSVVGKREPRFRLDLLQRV